jgi:HAMP domain-containing protein
LGVVEALQHNDDIMLQQIMTGLEQDREIVETMVVDADGQIRYATDPDKVATTSDDPLIKQCQTTGEGIATMGTNAGGKALILVAPLKIKGKRKAIGALRLEVTYKHLTDQVRTGQASFEMTAMGSMFLCIGGLLWGFRRWVTTPLTRLKNKVAAINPALLDANFPESDDEFGEMGKALNDLMIKLKAEWSAQRDKMTIQAGDERVLVEQLLRGLLPGNRVLLSDKQNRLVCDTGIDTEYAPGQGPHLLDIVHETDFAALVETAFRQEGEVARGKITYEAQSYQAAVLKIPEGQSKLVRAVIILSSQT